MTLDVTQITSDTNRDSLCDLKRRMTRAVSTLTELAAERVSGADFQLNDLGTVQRAYTEYQRLQGKVEGVRLAVSYIEDAIRQIDIAAGPDSPAAYEWPRIA